MFVLAIKSEGRNHINFHTSVAEKYCKVIDIVFNDDVIVLLIKKVLHCGVDDEKNCILLTRGS
jgi:hypothetical protein